MTMEALEDKLANMRGAVTMAFPMGLPKWDPVYGALEDKENGLAGTPDDAHAAFNRAKTPDEAS